MHELAFAQQVVRTVLESMRHVRATGVRSIEVELGVLEGVPTDGLCRAFEIESKDTPLEGADLRVALVPGTAACPACRAERALTIPAEGHRVPKAACDGCGGPVEFRGGRGLVVRSAAMILPDA